MMKYWIHTIFLLCCCISLQPCSVKAQNLDSLWTIWNDTTKLDGSRLTALHKIAWDGYLFSHPDSAFYFAKLEYDLAHEKGLKDHMSSALNTQAVAMGLLGDYRMASECLFSKLKILEELGDMLNIAGTLNNIAILYKNQENFPIALEYNNRALKIYDKEIFEIKGKIGKAHTLNNIGSIYMEQGDLALALECFASSLKIKQEVGDKSGIARSYGNIGMICALQGNYEQALEYYDKSLKIYQEVGNKEGMANTYNNIGNSYKVQGNYIEALEIGKKALSLAQEVGLVSEMGGASELLYNVYKKLGQPAKALEMYELYIEMHDSILSEKNIKALIQQQFKFSYEKKAAADSVKNAQLQEVKDAQLLVQQTQLDLEGNYRFALIGGLALITLFLAILYGRFQVNRRQKRLIEAASIKTKDSIKYAERIQQAILPSMGYIESCLENLFIIYKPKDIVSGDFYWVYKQKNENILIALADCTGHGVPGAFMSMIGTALLNEIIIENGETKVNKVLDTIRNHIISSFSQKDVKTHIYDGLDITLIDFNPETRTIKFAGAGQVFYILRNGEFIEERGDNYPVGYYFGRGKLFNLKEITLMPNDQLYLFTDGMIDQFGGEDKKKFGYNRLKAVILEGAHLPMDEQKKMLEEAILSWKGKGEQIDDISVMGIKIS